MYIKLVERDIQDALGSSRLAPEEAGTRAGAATKGVLAMAGTLIDAVVW